MPAELRENLPDFFLHILSLVNCKEAFALLEMLLELPGREEFVHINEVGAAWQGKDPAAAAAFAKEHNLSE